MVLDEGLNNGIGIWEVSGYNKLLGHIQNAAQQGISEQDHIDESDISVEEVLIVGSYGSGYGVPGKSDLDIVILTMYMGDIRSNDYSQCMRAIAGAINYRESSILSGFSEFTGIEAYVYPYVESQRHLSEMAQHEPVEQYYNLTQDQKKSYF